jgi:hypothetical protein
VRRDQLPITKFKVKHGNGDRVFFTKDELGAFKAAISQGTEDIEEITDVTGKRVSIRMYMRVQARKWIVNPPERK